MNDKQHKVVKSIIMVTQIGISMIVPIFICAALGVWLNRLTGTQICFLIMLFIGMGAAIRNLFIITKSFYSSDMEREHEKLKYIQELKDSGRKSTENTDEYVEITKKKRYPENKGPTRS